MIQCYIGLGSNLGDSLSIMHSVIHDLRESPSVVFQQASSFYKSKPLDNSAQPDYINAVCCILTELSPRQLLNLLQNLESKYGRVRSEKRWDSRTLDLDILLYGDRIINDEQLVVPHQELQLRDFVLFPLLEIAPDLKIPSLGNLTDLAKHCENRGMEKL